MSGYLIKCPHDAPCIRVCTVCEWNMLRELNQWRTGKRRVFWRVRKPGSVQDFCDRRDAWAEWKRGFRFTSRPDDDNVCGVTRVTVRPRGSK